MARPKCGTDTPSFILITSGKADTPCFILITYSKAVRGGHSQTEVELDSALHGPLILVTPAPHYGLTQYKNKNWKEGQQGVEGKETRSPDSAAEFQHQIECTCNQLFHSASKYAGILCFFLTLVISFFLSSARACFRVVLCKVVPWQHGIAARMGRAQITIFFCFFWLSSSSLANHGG
jgi:hypothetical protein